MVHKPTKLNILFTSVGRRVELVQQFREAANRLGVILEIFGADISNSAPAVAFCDQSVMVPRINAPEYIDSLLRICEEYCIDALIPTIDTDLAVLSSNKAAFSEVGTTVLISSPEKIAICRDKRQTPAYFQKLGLMAPEAVDRVDLYCGGFPAFIKPLDGSSSVGAYRAENMAELQYHAAHTLGYVIQPFVSGTEYTVDVFCDFDGKPIYITPRIRQAVRSGEVLKTRIHHHESIIVETLRLIEDFKPCGPITIQLIRNEETGVNHYIEINPRFGGGAPLSMKAGADAAVATLRLLLGQQLSYMEKAATEGAEYSRFDQSICVQLPHETPVQAVVFDLDDTLYAEKDYVRSGYSVVSQLLSQVQDCCDKLWAAFENGYSAIDHVLRKEGIYSDDLKNKCLNAYRAHKPDIQLYLGVQDLMIYLRQRGIKIGILTDGRPEGQRAKIAALGLDDLVDYIIVTDELGGPAFRKPNDIAFRIMKTKLDVPYGAMVYVGDNSFKDFQAPKALGMRWIHYVNPDGIYLDRISRTKNAVMSIEELKDALVEMI